MIAQAVPDQVLTAVPLLEPVGLPAAAQQHYIGVIYIEFKTNKINGLANKYTQ